MRFNVPQSAWADKVKCPAILPSNARMRLSRDRAQARLSVPKVCLEQAGMRVGKRRK
jgi:hypothetical protein